MMSINKSVAPRSPVADGSAPAAGTDTGPVSAGFVEARMSGPQRGPKPQRGRGSRMVDVRRRGSYRTSAGPGGHDISPLLEILDGVKQVAQFGASRLLVAGDDVFASVFTGNLQRVLKPVGLALPG
jgi:hypothetical protein